jgi:hypothetical protein
MEGAIGVLDAQHMESPSGDRVVSRSILTFVGLVVATAALVWLWESMRVVMSLGGACASGGPYVVATPCPHGTTLTTLGGIFGGLIGVLVYSFLGLRVGPRITVLAWSALFLSLGWNFLDFGLKAPSGSGAKVGWLICAVVFALMGGWPVAMLASRKFARDVLWSDGEGMPVGLRPGRTHVLFAGPTPTVTPTRSGQFPRASRLSFDQPMAPAPADDVGTALARVADLHDAGKLTDAEFAEAKARILEER